MSILLVLLVLVVFVVLVLVLVLVLSLFVLPSSSSSSSVSESTFMKSVASMLTKVLSAARALCTVQSGVGRQRKTV